MELLCPVCIIIHFGANGKECVLVLSYLLFGKLLSVHSLCKDGLYLRVGILLVIELLYAMVGETASVLCEEVVPLLQSVDHILECIDAYT